MAKYGFELKKQIVQEYLNGEGGKKYLAKKYGVADPTKIMDWVKKYQIFGNDALMRSRANKKYSFEYKLHVVELYLTDEVSYRELALSEGISNEGLIVKWVNDFRVAGPDALRPKKKGRKKLLKSSDKKEKVSSVEINPVDTSAEYVKQLEDELLKLRIENAYLKELRRLRLEEETLLKRRRESSTASEETSN